MRNGRLKGFVIMMLVLLTAGCSEPPVQSHVPVLAASPAQTPAALEVQAAPSPVDSEQPAQQEGTILQNMQVDLDHNGTLEQVQLMAGQDLAIKAGGQREVVYPNFQYIPVSAFTIYQQRPKVDVIDGPNGDKRLLVSVVWATNKIGSTAKLWLYKFESGILTRMWDSDSEPKDARAQYKGGNFVGAEIPSYDLKQRIELSTEHVKMLAEGNGSGQVQTHELPGTTTEYGLRDYNGDGAKELMLRRLTCLGGCPIYLTTLYTFFDLNADSVHAVKSFFASNLEQEIIEGILKDDELKIDVTRTRWAANFRDEGVTPQAVDRTLNRLSEAGIIERAGSSGVWQLSIPLRGMSPGNSLK